MTTASAHLMTTRRRHRVTAEAASVTKDAAEVVTTPTTDTNYAATKVKKYRNRDSHKTFFRPGAKQQSKKLKAKNQKKISTGLTDKQRVKEALTHWIIQHGSASDAGQFMKMKSNTSNVSTETIDSLILMTINPFDQSADNPSNTPPTTKLNGVTAADEPTER